MTSLRQLVWAKKSRLRAVAAAWLFLFAQFFVVAHEAEAGPDHAAADCEVCITAQRDETAIAADPPSIPAPLSCFQRFELVVAQSLRGVVSAAGYSVRAPPLV